ncbi:MAG: helix-turn-helix transcriptional regulator [Sphingobacteriales bacterium]|nr:helix-turn-helix transcriptional regulator [Sphingobacteriales bacterium]
MHPFLIPGADRRVYQAPFGQGLVQEIKAMDCSVTEFRFWITEPETLYPVAPQPVLSLVYALGGDLVCELKGFGEIELNHKHCYLLYIPGGIPQVARYGLGEHRIVHVNLGTGLLRPTAEKFPAFQETLQRLESGSDLGLQQLSLPISFEVRDILERMLKFPDEGVSREMLLASQITKLVYHFIRYTEGIPVPVDNSGTSEIKKERVEAAKQHIDKHEGKPLNGEDLQRLVYYNIKQLNSDFKEYYGKTLFEYQRELRMKKGAKLVAETQLSFLKIALEVGYNELSTFSRQFKQFFNMTPTEYRKLMQGPR